MIAWNLNVAIGRYEINRRDVPHGIDVPRDVRCTGFVVQDAGHGHPVVGHSIDEHGALSIYDPEIEMMVLSPVELNVLRVGMYQEFIRHTDTSWVASSIVEIGEGWYGGPHIAATHLDEENIRLDFTMNQFKEGAKYYEFVVIDEDEVRIASEKSMPNETKPK